MAILGAIFIGCIIYSCSIIIAGIKWPGIHHNVFNVFLPPVIISLLILILQIFTSVNFRIRLDFIWFTFGSWSPFVYCLFVAGIIIMIVAIIGGLVPLWKARKEPSWDKLRLPPRVTCLILVVTAGISLPMLFTVLFYFPWTQVFWTNMLLMYDRYTAGAIGCLVTIVASNCAAIIVARYMKGKTRIRPWHEALLPAAIGILCAASIVAIVLMDIDMRATLGSELAGLEAYASFPAVLLVICFLVLELGSTRLRGWLVSVFLQRLKSNRGRAMIALAKKKGFVLAMSSIVVAAAFFATPVIVTPPVVDMSPTFELRVVDGITLPFQNGVVYPCFERQPESIDGGARTRINLTSTWRFSFVPGASDLSYYPRTPGMIALLAAGFESVAFDDALWANLAVPSSFNKPENPPIAGYEGAQGICWYRKWVSSAALEHVENSTVRLNFLGTNYISDVWVDGRYAGYHEGGFTASSFDITGLLVPNETDHLLAVRVDTGGFKNRYYAKEVPGFADWFNYGGIVRDVTIDIAPRVHVIRADVRATAILPDAGSALSGNASIRANVSIGWPESAPAVEIGLALRPLSFPNTTALLDDHTWRNINVSTSIAPNITSGQLSKNFPAGGMPGSPFAAVTFTFTAGNLRLWTNKQPTLYALEISINRSSDHALIDRFYTQVGFRNFTVENAEFRLNGMRVFIAGASIHEERPTSGRTLTPGEIATDLTLLKSLSCNTFRCHYPLHPLYYLWADRIGLSSWQECPDYWFNEVNLIEARRGSTRAMFLEMLFRDFNRPSVFFMAVTNEPLSEGSIVPYLRERKQLLASIDRSRVFGFAAASPYLVNPAHAITDIVGSNCYWGLSDGVRGDYANQAQYAISTIASANPGKPIIITEFGTGNYWDAESVSAFDEYCTAFTGNPAVHGILYWVFNDYMTHGGYWGSWVLYNNDRTQERPVAASMRATYGSLTSANP